MNYCKVRNCRFPNSHVTKMHLCGKCKSYGHGNIECDSVIQKENLIAHNGYDELTLYDYPSYKIDTDTGSYSLHKHRKGRLPGFADRIIFKGVLGTNYIFILATTIFQFHFCLSKT